MTNPNLDERPRCYFCNDLVDQHDHFCWGCHEYMCDRCDLSDPFGKHKPEQHRVEDLG